MPTDQPAEQQIARLTLLAEARYLPAALAVVREAGAAVGLAAADVIGLDRAVDQVASNVIEHGFERGERATFDLVVLRRPGQLVVAIEDAGLPFDFSDLEVGQGSTLAAPSLAAFADAIRFSSLGARGNRVEIVKRLPFTPIDVLGPDPTPAASPGPPVPATTPVTVRLMTPDDAIAVARCTYACYGYTVPDDYLYCPDHLREMLLGGLLEVCVGATADGEIVSCLTRELTRPGAPVGYVGEGMVAPPFRGHRLLEQMLTFLMRGAAAQQMLGLYAEAVTVHVFSQKSNLALGAFETGIQLADEAPTVVFKQIDAGAPAKRTATVLHYFKTGDAPPRTVHLPPHHRAMVERIYARGGLPRSVADAGGSAEQGDGAQVRVEVFPVWSEAALRVTAYGRDLPGSSRSGCASCGCAGSTGSAWICHCRIPPRASRAPRSRRLASSSRGSFPSWTATTFFACNTSTTWRPMSTRSRSHPTSARSCSRTSWRRCAPARTSRLRGAHPWRNAESRAEARARSLR